jgi:aromatic ring hydroxylase
MACVETVASTTVGHDPQYKDLALVYDEELGENISRYIHVPKNGEDLLKPLELISRRRSWATVISPWHTTSVPTQLIAISITARTMGDGGRSTWSGSRITGST